VVSEDPCMSPGSMHFPWIQTRVVLATLTCIIHAQLSGISLSVSINGSAANGSSANDRASNCLDVRKLQRMDCTRETPWQANIVLCVTTHNVPQACSFMFGFAGCFFMIFRGDAEAENDQFSTIALSLCRCLELV
jgi:hypothetical protein